GLEGGQPNEGGQLGDESVHAGTQLFLDVCHVREPTPKARMGKLGQKRWSPLWTTLPSGPTPYEAVSRSAFAAASRSSAGMAQPRKRRPSATLFLTRTDSSDSRSFTRSGTQPASFWAKVVCTAWKRVVSFTSSRKGATAASTSSETTSSSAWMTWTFGST